MALRLGAALFTFWYVRGRLAEGERWLAEALALGADAPPLARARALRAVGALRHQRGDFHQTEATEQALALFRELGDRRGEAAALRVLGMSARRRGDLDTADTHLEASLAICRAEGDRHGAAMALVNLGIRAQERRQYGRAVAHLEEALALFRAIGETRRVARTLMRLGIVAQARGDYERAVALCGEGLAAFAALGFQPGIGDCLETFAELALATGQPERAARLFGSAESVRETASASVTSVAPAAHEQHLAQARDGLDATTFARARAEGRAMPLDRAIAYALEATGGRPLRLEPCDAGLVDGLTARECEVASLVAQGLSNRQIAAALVITERTAEKHVANILDKLAFASRAQVATWAVERGLREQSKGLATE